MSDIPADTCSHDDSSLLAYIQRPGDGCYSLWECSECGEIHRKEDTL